ncbi:MAG: allantoinase [Chthoniobacter sp.]|nr:allantoinase [Chthoniobacter sp.]
MSEFDLLIRGATPFPEIAIANGKFVAFEAGTAREEIDASGFHVFPGVIDAHVHFNEPGRIEWEGIATGSRACAAGGTTTFFDMPLNAHPPTIDGASFDEKLRAAEAQSLVDFGLWGGLVPGNLDQLETLRDRGVVGLKAFMSNSGINDFANVDWKTLRAGMKRAASCGLLVAVHAESERITQALSQERIAGGRTSVRDYLYSRPIEAELSAIRNAISFAAETGCALHIVHVSCSRGVAAVAAARARGVNVTCETCPHYLVLTEEDMQRIGALAKCAPPLRSERERQLLLERVRAGGISTIGSDHSPSPPSMKTSANFFEVWGGISGCQHLLPLLIDVGIAPEAIAQLTSQNVARRFHIAPQKGAIAIGADADFSLVDLQATQRIAPDSLFYRHRQTPYAGREVRGRVMRTFLRGQTIFHDGRFSDRPLGQLIKPNP